jgi:hypothetical protein
MLCFRTSSAGSYEEEKVKKKYFSLISDLKRMKDLHHDHLGKIQIHISVFLGLKQGMGIPISKMSVGINIKSLNFALTLANISWKSSTFFRRSNIVNKI